MIGLKGSLSFKYCYSHSIKAFKMINSWMPFSPQTLVTLSLLRSSLLLINNCSSLPHHYSLSEYTAFFLQPFHQSCPWWPPAVKMIYPENILNDEFCDKLWPCKNERVYFCLISMDTDWPAFEAIGMVVFDIHAYINTIKRGVVIITDQQTHSVDVSPSDEDHFLLMDALCCHCKRGREKESLIND